MSTPADEHSNGTQWPRWVYGHGSTPDPRFSLANERTFLAWVRTALAVVAAPDDRWGEVPVAFVTLRPEASVTEDELIEHVRSRLARFKAPKRVVVGELPKTGTGKIQKFVLREQLWAGRSDRIGAL